MPFSLPPPYTIARAARQTTLALLLAGAVIAPAQAQTAGRDPLTAAPSNAPLSYRSIFETYRPFRAEPPSDWRELNDAVRFVGGHSGALKNAPAPASAPPPSHPAARSAPEQPAPPAMPTMPVESAPMPSPRH